MEVIIENANSKMWHIETKVAEIIYSLINDNEVIINLNNEGPCCEDIGLYNILDFICEKFKFIKSSITIETSNILENHEYYNVCVRPQTTLIDIVKKHSENNNIITKYKKNDKVSLIGIFVGRASWVRIWLSSILWRNYSDKIIGSFHWNNTSDVPLTHIELNEMIKFGASFNNIKNASDFLDNAPYELYKGVNLPITENECCDIIEYYDSFFVEIVCETYFSGNTFFPTEKTWRSIATKTPFIIHASTDFLRNLRKLGFKTFDKWWSEEYDDYGHETRIEKIIEIIDYLANLTPSEIQDMYNDMHDTLEHNYKIFNNLTEETFRRTFIE